MKSIAKITYLTIEQLDAPIGIDVAHPHFAWRMADNRENAHQKAYQIEVEDETGHRVWDSQRVESDNSVQIKYIGEPLKPCTGYKVKVRIWDGDNKETESVESSFETGWYNRRWQGTWLKNPKHQTRIHNPVGYFRKSLNLPKQCVKARLYITSLGIFEAYFNGSRISDELFSPGWTDYYTRTLCRTYDITDYIKTGDNVLGVKLADGWFSGRIASLINDNVPTYGTTPKLRAMLAFTFADGTKELVGSDATWKFNENGPERIADIYDGETYDDNMTLDGFADASFDDQSWQAAKECGAGVKIEGLPYSPVVRFEELVPQSITKISEDKVILDFGQNFAGRERLEIDLPKGSWVEVLHAEMLKDDGTLYTEALRTAKARSYFISSGRKVDFETSFTFYGFRYIQISSDKLALLDLSKVRAIVIHSDIKRTGFFECSNSKINKLYSNIIWGQRSNYLDIPTDCPQRDERLGWTGDAQIFVKVGSYNFQVDNFFRKYMRDLVFTQNEFGDYAPFVPCHFQKDNCWDNVYGAAGWADAGLICPNEMLIKYDDKQIVADNYESMKAFIASRVRNSEDFIDSHAFYGDWLNVQSPLPQELLGTAFFAYSVKLLAKFAKVLNKVEDIHKYEELFNNIKAAYQKRFLDSEGRLRKDTANSTKRSPDIGESKNAEMSCRTQTSMILSLHFGLLPESSVLKVVDDLVEEIMEKHKGHLSTGFLGTPYIVQVLAKYGRSDIAYKLLEENTYPSWLYSVEQGATTIWERWNSFSHENGFGDISMNSFNHYAYGAVGDFFYESIGGIQPLENGFKTFRIAPIVGGTLTHARTEYRSEYGQIISSWKTNGNKFILEVVIPANTKCIVSMPDGSEHSVGSGHYSYTCAYRHISG